MSLISTNDQTEPRFREVFNKAGHALGWFGSIASTGEAPSKTSSGERYTPIDSGFFVIRSENLGNYVPPTGFSVALLLTQLGIFADHVDLSRLALKVFNLATSLTKETDNMLLLAGGKIYEASLTARFGRPSEAIRLGLEVVKYAGAQRKLRHDGSRPLDATIRPLEIWESLSLEERQNSERELLWLAIGPVYAEMLGSDLSQDELENRLADLENALVACKDELEDWAFWNRVIHYLRTLMLTYLGKTTVVKTSDIPDDDNLLKAFWYLVFSNAEDTSLRDSFIAQVNAVDFLIRSQGLERHILPGIGKFVFRFWSKMAEMRGFALASPQLFREELRGISPAGGARTAARVLMTASRSISVSLPKEILARFQEAAK